MSGSISLSMSQQFDEHGSPLSGGLLYFIEAGTTSTPQNAYQDSDLTIAHANPITLDSAGRVPQFYLADGSIKIRLTDSGGVQQIVADNILVIGPSSGSGGGGSVDATTVLQTGDIKVRYGTGTHSGWVRANGRTIGSSTSGATERANADTQALFEYLWGADANLTVSTGRGASANDDWTADKTIALPDWRGRALAGLDDMGTTAAGVLTSTYFGSAATALGATGGAQSCTLIEATVPALTFSGTTNAMNANAVHSHGISGGNTVGQSSTIGAGGAAFTAVITPATLSINNANIDHAHTYSGTTSGGGQAHPNVQPTKLATIYVKL